MSAKSKSPPTSPEGSQRQKPSRRTTRNFPIRKSSLLTPSAAVASAVTTTSATDLASSYFFPEAAAATPAALARRETSPEPPASETASTVLTAEPLSIHSEPSAGDSASVLEPARPSIPISTPAPATQPAPAPVLAPPVTLLPAPPMADSDSASIKKGGRGAFFASMAVNAFRRRSSSPSASPDRSTSNPALSSLLETQKRDEVARSKAQGQAQSTPPTPEPAPAPASTPAPAPAPAPAATPARSASPARVQPQPQSRSGSQTPPRSRTPPRRDVSAEGYHSGIGSDSEGDTKSMKERRSVAKRLGGLAKSNSLTRVLGLNRKRRTSDASVDAVAPPEPVSRAATSESVTQAPPVEQPAGPTIVDSPPAIATPPPEPAAPVPAPAPEPEPVQPKAAPAPAPAPAPEPEPEPVQAPAQAVEEAPAPAPAPVPAPEVVPAAAEAREVEAAPSPDPAATVVPPIEITLEEEVVPTVDEEPFTMSPIVEETPSALEPSPPADTALTHQLEPPLAPLDLSSPPASPMVVRTNRPQSMVIPPEQIEQLTQSQTESIDGSAVLVPRVVPDASVVDIRKVEDESAPAQARMTPVSNAPADSGIIQLRVEETDVETRTQEHEWEEIEPAHHTPERALNTKFSMITDDGSLAESAASVIDHPQPSGTTFVSLLSQNAKGSSTFEDEGASTVAQMGDSANTSERAPPTPYTIAYTNTDADGEIPGAMPKFTPPITPDSEKFPEIPKSTGKRAVGPSPLATNEPVTNEKSVRDIPVAASTRYPASASTTTTDTTTTATATTTTNTTKTTNQNNVPESKPRSSKERIPDEGELTSGLMSLLPSRETVDVAAQYAVSFILLISALSSLIAFVPCVSFFSALPPSSPSYTLLESS
ncbi:hypothetical protein FRB99_001844 [Tulasnella sp. 403]|nr:hypothetical protein FRB99_001844 [Tulasnella sp. 403]